MGPRRHGKPYAPILGHEVQALHDAKATLGITGLQVHLDTSISRASMFNYDYSIVIDVISI